MEDTILLPVPLKWEEYHLFPCIAVLPFQALHWSHGLELPVCALPLSMLNLSSLGVKTVFCSSVLHQYSITLPCPHF